MNIGYKIKSQISESQIEADVASYLGFITPFWSKRFQLLAVDEQVTGADKLFDRFIPIYMQFKVSEGLHSLESNFKPKNPKRPLQKIRLLRRDNSLPGDPILYFKLRDLAKGATDYQNNQLLKMNDPPNKYGVYVAPLTLDFDEYNKSLNPSFFERLFLWKHFRTNNQKDRTLFKLLPFLRGHIAIAPQVSVKTSQHHYSFSKSGNDLAFQSGEIIEGDFRLSTFIYNLYQSYYNNQEIGFSRNAFLTEIDDYYALNENVLPPNPELRSDDKIIEYTKHLNTERGIRLMILGSGPL